MRTGRNPYVVWGMVEYAYRYSVEEGEVWVTSNGMGMSRMCLYCYIMSLKMTVAKLGTDCNCMIKNKYLIEKKNN